MALSGADLAVVEALVDFGRVLGVMDVGRDFSQVSAMSPDMAAGGSETARFCACTGLGGTRPDLVETIESSTWFAGIENICDTLPWGVSGGIFRIIPRDKTSATMFLRPDIDSIEMLGKSAAKQSKKLRIANERDLCD